VQDKPRLIEVAFPLEQASLASVHEKNVRHGHISTLHIWPARRPLAACRAALLCTLLPDPGDPVKRKELLEKIGGTVRTTLRKNRDGNGNLIEEEIREVEGGVLKWGQENAPAMDELREMIKAFYGGDAPKVMDPFAGGGAIPLEAMRLACDVTAADINPVAWFILKCTLEYPQKFAGKKWPLPGFVSEWPDFIEDFLAGKVKKRRGKKKPHFSDPQQIQMFKLPDADLAWHVRAWGRWVLEHAKADLNARYPMIKSEPTVAYLWARTARDKLTLGRIPLLKTFWLNKKSGKRTAILPVPKEDRSGVTFALLNNADLAKPEKVINKHSFLKDWGITSENLISFLNAGTMNRSGVWSPCSGRPGLIALTMDDLRLQGQQGLLGSQMTVVVVESTASNRKKTFKRYRLPEQEEIKAAQVDEPEEIFQDVPFGIPEEPTPLGGGSGASRAFSIQRYGLKKWRDLFTPRQLFALGVFVKHTRRAIEEIGKIDEAAREAVGAYLSLIFNRVADRGSTICTWTVNWNKIRNTFARFALPITWDFVESVTTIETSGGYPGQMELVAKYIEHALGIGFKDSLIEITRQSATSDTENSADFVFTDPPYYDAIPYSDLMDFFYIWLRRNQYGFNQKVDRVFSERLSPKWDHKKQDGELIDDESRFGGDKNSSKKAYEDGMAKAFKRCCDGLAAEGRITVVFANKDVVAWETLINALIRGGATVTASWPIRTEMPNRVRGMSGAALSSSVWIVCRKRPETARFGWDTDVLEHMKNILFNPRDELGGINILQYYFDLGIRGPDFIWAALGPALQAYSAHPFVKKQTGGAMTVGEFLAEVRRLVLQFSLGELPGLREVQKDTAGRGEGIELDPVTQYYLLHRAYFGLEPAPAGPCILYANACGKNETELKVVWNIIEQGGKSKRGRPRKDEEDEQEDTDDATGKGNEYRLLRWEERVKRESLGKVRVAQPAPLIDRLHRLMHLLQQNRVFEMQEAYDGWGLASDIAFKPLLQAVRELADRDRQDTERRIVEALASQLRMNKRTIVSENMVREEPLFEYGKEKGK
jgi:adenine-specific DNA methylase